MKKSLLRILSIFLALCTMTTCFFGCDFYDSGDEEPTPPQHVCVYNKKVTADEYKASDATCLEKGEYYYSCECGEKGASKFEYGKIAEHNYKNNECIWCGDKKSVPQTPTKPEQPQTTPTQPEDTSRLVYITPTGKRYHYSKACAGKNATESTINKAEKKGLTGCKNCT